MDNSDEIIRNLSKNVEFPVIYINSSHRVGKSKMDNLLIEESKGEYIVWCDSDDYFVDNALEILSEAKKIPVSQKNQYTGVHAQNIDIYGKSQTFNDDSIPGASIHTLYDLLDNHVIGDGTNLVLSKHLKGQKYLEVDFLITESSLLEKVFDQKSTSFTTDSKDYG